MKPANNKKYNEIINNLSSLNSLKTKYEAQLLKTKNETIINKIKKERKKVLGEILFLEDLKDNLD